jgi:hypothetical protein
MKAQIYSAYVAGLCPLEMLMKYGPDSHRDIRPAPVFDETSVDIPRTPSRRKRWLILILTLGFAIGAWQLLSNTDEKAAAAASAQASTFENRVQRA